MEWDRGWGFFFFFGFVCYNHCFPLYATSIGSKTSCVALSIKGRLCLHFVFRIWKFDWLIFPVHQSVVRRAWLALSVLPMAWIGGGGQNESFHHWLCNSYWNCLIMHLLYAAPSILRYGYYIRLAPFYSAVSSASIDYWYLTPVEPIWVHTN